MIRSPRSVALTKRSESCKLRAYPDPRTNGDPWTCGWGSTGPDIHAGTVWTQATADARLASRMAQDDGRITAMLAGRPTTQGQFDAMADFAYNEGLSALQTSTLLRYHLAGNYVAAANEFPKWNTAKGKVMGGLVTRRAAEQALYRGN